MAPTGASPVTQNPLTSLGAIGPISDVFIPLDEPTARPRGLPFVECEADDDAAKAIEALKPPTLQAGCLSSVDVLVLSKAQLTRLRGG